MPKKKADTGGTRPSVARIEYLGVKNYRALRDVRLEELTPLTVLLGPNGSGKSTVFDVFDFLSECFTLGLRRAWDKRGRFQELRTRGSEGRIVFELRYRERSDLQPATYHLEIDERDGSPLVAEEWLRWRRVAKNAPGAPYRILSFQGGGGWVITGEDPKASDKKVRERLDEPDMLAVSTLGQLAKHPRVAALRRFITDWYVSYLSIEQTRGQPEAGPQERLNKSGANLANVIQYLQERHPGQLDRILRVMRERVPRLQSVATSPMPDGRLLLQLKDAPFERPILSRFASDGTLKMLAYLTVLYDPDPPQFIGIEEPENFLHPRLLAPLSEECRAAAERAQLLVTTHSPFFLESVRPNEIRVLYRDAAGHCQAVRASVIPGILEFMEEGASMGHLWTEGHLMVGDPLSGAGEPRGGKPKR